VSGAKAGAIAAAGWGLAELLAGRAFGVGSYSDVRLLGRTVTRRRAWPVAGFAWHVANGAAFGAAFDRLGLRGAKQGIVAAQIENLALWPGMLVVDRIHPDRRDGTWPRLVANRRIALYEVTMHALFGAALGVLSRRR
jgi:hypothetical protein